MAKHVFELTTDGSIYHKGEFVKETEKTVTYLCKYFRRETRMLKGWGCAVVEVNSPEIVTRTWESTWGRYRADIRRLDKELADIKDEQRNAAKSAILSIRQEQNS